MREFVKFIYNYLVFMKSGNLSHALFLLLNYIIYPLTGLL